MTSHGQFTEIAALAGDPARAGMLHALLDGRALTATELASVAGMTPQTASGHLARLTAVELISGQQAGPPPLSTGWPRRGRADDGSIMQVAANQQPPQPSAGRGPRDAAARGPHRDDHLAGRPALPWPIRWSRLAMSSSQRKPA